MDYRQALWIEILKGHIAGVLFFGGIIALVLVAVLTIPWMQYSTGNIMIRAASICENITAAREEDRQCSPFQATGELLEETHYRNLIGREWISYNLIRGKR